VATLELAPMVDLPSRSWRASIPPRTTDPARSWPALVRRLRTACPSAIPAAILPAQECMKTPTISRAQGIGMQAESQRKQRRKEAKSSLTPSRPPRHTLRPPAEPRATSCPSSVPRARSRVQSTTSRPAEPARSSWASSPPRTCPRATPCARAAPRRKPWACSPPTSTTRRCWRPCWPTRSWSTAPLLHPQGRAPLPPERDGPRPPPPATLRAALQGGRRDGDRREGVLRTALG